MERQTHMIRLGFAPTRRVLHTPKAFNREEAIRQKNEIERELKNIPGLELVNLDFLNEEGLLSAGSDGLKVAEHFRRAGVDAVFVPHCNFGSEEAVAKLCRELGKPVLLWGPRDEGPAADGSRLRDSQCGLFATSKVLMQMGVEFSYITNCSVTDPAFRKGLDRFLGAASMVKAMTRLRIGQIGTRPEIFWSVKNNELELLEKFGIEVVPITMKDLERMLGENREILWEEIREEGESMARRFPQSGFSPEEWGKLANLKLTIRNWCREMGLSAAASQCWKPMDLVAGTAPCFVFSELTGEGLPIICESDIHGAVSSVIAMAASRWQSPSFLADLTIRHPENDNAELLWHCGVFPNQLAADPAKVEIGRHFNRQNPAVGTWELRRGDITLVRFDGCKGEYSCLMGHGRGVEGPETFGTYLWAEFDNWPEWEHAFIRGPYIHHCAGVYGKLAPVIWEACRYIPNLQPDPVSPSKDEILSSLI